MVSVLLLHPVKRRQMQRRVKPILVCFVIIIITYDTFSINSVTEEKSQKVFDTKCAVFLPTKSRLIDYACNNSGCRSGLQAQASYIYLAEGLAQCGRQADLRA